mmetsp:Transcript_7714/g.7131  ORF Transcript_7714/g.7131 Transcript_7714/m.7131 type:complete len:170 (+) Transcript_7714:1162-1671(+)
MQRLIPTYPSQSLTQGSDLATERDKQRNKLEQDLKIMQSQFFNVKGQAESLLHLFNETKGQKKEMEESFIQMKQDNLTLNEQNALLKDENMELEARNQLLEESVGALEERLASAEQDQIYIKDRLYQEIMKREQGEQKYKEKVEKQRLLLMEQQRYNEKIHKLMDLNEQ